MTSPRFPRRSLVIVLAALLAACGGDDADDGSVAAIRVADAPSLPTTVDALPDMDVAGFDALMAELEGTPTVVNFWATWCDPCVREMPRLAEAAERYRDRIQFLGVDIADAREPARRFLRDLAIPYPNVFDGPGALRTAVGGVGQPVTAFYDAEGLVRVISGEVGQDDLDAMLEQLLTG